MKHLVIVGAGITGLLTALRIYKDYQITVIDLGSDPRLSRNLSGSTYSGLDARHISFTETAPWTSSYRHKLIMTKSADQGWLTISRKDLNGVEKNWITRFKETAKDEIVHKSNTFDVINLNKQGIIEWEKLGEEYDFLKPIEDETVMPIICRSKEDLMDEFSFESSLDNRCKLYLDNKLPDTLSALSSHLENLGDFGYFTLFGRSYKIKTICTELINFLEPEGVKFIWNQPFSKTEADLIVWCAGISPQASIFLRQFNILLGGVIGCWVAIDNTGITKACKIFGPEPINYLNLTPVGSTVLISGGYGFVGTHFYAEATQFAQPIMDFMIEEIKRWLPEGEIKERAFCIRPSTPTGVPVLVKDHLDKTPIIFAVGHCAGGFTQAPYTAKMIEKEIHSM